MVAFRLWQCHSEKKGENQLAQSPFWANGEMRIWSLIKNSIQQNSAILALSQHLGAHWVENEQSRAFHFACPAKAVDKFHHLRVNAGSSNSALSLAFCQTPGNPEESSNVTGKKLRTWQVSPKDRQNKHRANSYQQIKFVSRYFTHILYYPDTLKCVHTTRATTPDL